MNVIAIVLDYRRPDLTAACVGSLARQVRRVLVVDNSADRECSARLRERLAAHLAADADPPVTLLTPDRNLGFAAGVNYALAEARHLPGRADAFLLLNNDARLHADTVAALSRALAAQPGALVAPAATDDGAPGRYWYQPAWGLITRRALPGAYPYLSAGCLLVPRALTADLLDEDFFMYGEDIELGWRMRRDGVALITVPDAHWSHIGGASAPRGRMFYEVQMARAHVVLARKLARGSAQAVWWLALRVVSLFVRACLRTLRQRSAVPLRALVSAWRGEAVPASS